MNVIVRVIGCSLVGLSLTLIGAGCASLESRMPVYDQALSANPVSLGQARVCVARRANMLGAMVPHYAVDAGSDAPFDAKLVRRQDIQVGSLSEVSKGQYGHPVRIELKDPGFSDKGVRGSVAFLVLPEYRKDSHGIVLPAGTGDMKIGIVKKRNDVFTWELGRGLFGQSVGGPSVNITSAVVSAPYNCRYLGKMGNGGYVAFYRKPGIMRLRVVTEGGDECFAPDFSIEAGKKYFVDYQYRASGPTFVIQERP